MEANINKNNKFSILTLGCKTNQSESDEIAYKLSIAGMLYTGDYLTADVVIINTCTVTLASDSKVRQLIRKVKKKNRKALLIVTGCYVVLNEDFLQKENIGKIFSNEKKAEIPDFVINRFGRKTQINAESSKEDVFSQIHTRQLIKIQDGCRQKCSYCIVPFVRDKYISEPPEKIIKEIDLICRAGLEEIVLAGTHIGKYGIEISQNIDKDSIKKNKDIYSLKNLLELILEKTDIKRIRLSSIEVNELSEELIEIIANSRRIAKHLHIPLQSGSDRILKLMKRPYNIEFFSKKLIKIKEKIPEITFTTDVIVGFPDEREEDFYKTINLIEKFLFSKAHVFRFSPRPGTAAENMEKQVAENIKYFRALLLRNYCDLIRKKYIQGFLKKRVSVSIEKIDKEKEEAYGMSEEYIKTMLSLKNGKASEHISQGRIYDVLVTKIDENRLVGKLLD
ncbi:MAG: tRNA (N(6)-L-threonylcarbamoyladenosine(37)-C(2))-methylthiotransferase MtaB [Actinomycetota bacterium]|nr:tRNA (N(6)-L-threonylcarbamoyladenosine(37)-C(2))-methylthiotransferase MtaB [Actinomycetota bacterium]